MNTTARRALRLGLTLGVIQAFFYLPSTSHALNLRYFWDNDGGTGDSEFTNPDNWGAENGEPAGTGRLPGHWLDVGDDPTHSSDSATNDTTNAIHQGGGTINLNSNFTPANPFDILIIRSSNSSLNIAADLNLAGIPILIGQTATTTGNTITQTTGTVTTSGLNIGDGGNSTPDGTATYTMSGGALNVSGNLSLVNNNAVASTLSLQGDSATVSVGGDLILSGDAGLGTPGDPTLDFQLGASGINAIDVTGAFTIDATNSLLTIDGSSYTGGAAIIDLVTFGSLTGTFTDPANISLSGFTGFDTSVGYDADSMFLSLTSTAVPEPTEAVVFLLGMTGLLAGRRRKTARS